MFQFSNIYIEMNNITMIRIQHISKHRELIGLVIMNATAPLKRKI